MTTSRRYLYTCPTTGKSFACGRAEAIDRVVQGAVYREYFPCAATGCSLCRRGILKAWRERVRLRVPS